ncbi:MAG TPA: GrpB family protein [Vicinamibacterales bacterium]|nr:GrpB family protein [Vicinamibacterales bacterium]
MLGLKHGLNVLADYDPGWPIAFEQERQRIRSAVGDIARGVEHYGSTAVEGLRAKPILDILLGVAALDDWIKCKAPLEDLGYDYAETAGVADHFVFGRGRDRTERTHLVHVVEFDGEAWRANLRFRDALRTNQVFRAEYLRVKERAIALAPEGRARYNDLKQSFFDAPHS